ncbi:MAG: translation initiation factor IF-2 [Thermoplasmataceae archaeon]|jgi:translation initiation factor 5B
MKNEGKELRQPIVCVLGHVDHGKTTLLDAIRGTSIAKKEEGGITQRIGATEIDITRIKKIAQQTGSKSLFTIPGLLFVDTPGHVAFSNMRSRGGALADIAILVIDINEGIKPQTEESINILKKFKTPFIIAANKVDLIDFAIPVKDSSFKTFLAAQRDEFKNTLDEKIYKVVNSLYTFGFPSERYDRITDFSKNVAIIPVSAKNKIGIQDILLIIAGLAQKFLEESISRKYGTARATVMEVKKEESLGNILDSILYQGELRKGALIALNTREGPAKTKIKALFLNQKTSSSKLVEVEKVEPASGVRILISDKLNVIPGSPLIEIENDEREAYEEILKETAVTIDLSEHGVTLRADTLGSLEAIAYELSEKGIRIRNAQIGLISRRDVIDVATLQEPLDRIILGFNVEILPEAKEVLLNQDVGVINGGIIYALVQQCEEWINNRTREIEEERKKGMSVPSRFKIIPEYIFRANKPVIVGVKMESGRIKVGDNLIREDGRYAGTIKSIREGELSKKFAEAPSEVAIAIDGVTLNRQIFPDEPIYTDITEETVKVLRLRPMDEATMRALEEIIKIKRKENKFWGTRA